jgi:hypothetical protein
LLEIALRSVHPHEELWKTASRLRRDRADAHGDYSAYEDQLSER